MNYALELDHQLFYFIYGLPHPTFFQYAAIFLSGVGLSALLWLFLSILLLYREEKKDHWFFLPMLLAAIFSELVTNRFLKLIFARNRPPGAGLDDFSFPSGHATFAWALAVVLAQKEPRAAFFFYGLAFLISLSRIYLGVHYPADVVMGALVGIILAWISLMLSSYVRRTRIPKSPRRSKEIQSP